MPLFRIELGGWFARAGDPFRSGQECPRSAGRALCEWCVSFERAFFSFLHVYG
jgi:hypothetical protein